MSLFESRDGYVRSNNEYYFNLDPRLVEGVFYRFDPPGRWTRPIALKYVSESEMVSSPREVPRPTRKPGKSRYSSPIPKGLFPDTPLRDVNGREYALVGRRQLEEGPLMAIREKTEDMLYGKAVVLERLDGRVGGFWRVTPGEENSFAVVVFDVASSYAQVEIEPEIRLRLEEEYRLLPARPNQDVVFQGIVHVGQGLDGSEVTTFEYLPSNFFTNDSVERTLALIQRREAERYMTEPQAAYGYATLFSKLIATSV